jgi:hypothetical protein
MRSMVEGRQTLALKFLPFRGGGRNYRGFSTSVLTNHPKIAGPSIT